MTKNQKVRGFTIIELLVVISIISILMTLSLIGASTVRMRARDAKRKTDLRKAQGVLILYYADKKTYPLPCGATTSPANTFPCYYDGSVGGYNLMMNGDNEETQVFKGLKGSGYTDSLIQDEKYDATAAMNDYAFRYRPSNDGLNFELSAKLENGNDNESTKDAAGAGSDVTRYEVGTDKSIRTEDCTLTCNSSDEYVNYDLTTGADPAVSINWTKNDGDVGKWTYEFDTSKTCTACKME